MLTVHLVYQKHVPPLRWAYQNVHKTKPWVIYSSTPGLVRHLLIECVIRDQDQLGNTPGLVQQQYSSTHCTTAVQRSGATPPHQVCPDRPESVRPASGPKPVQAGDQVLRSQKPLEASHFTCDCIHVENILLLRYFRCTAYPVLPKDAAVLDQTSPECYLRPGMTDGRVSER